MIHEATRSFSVLCVYFVALVVKKKNMKSKDEIVPVTVFSGTIYEAEMVKSLLENADIETFLKDENIGTMAPWYSAPGGAGSVSVVVPSPDLEKAREIVAEYEKNVT
jgi:hypothetical protein